MTLCSITSLLLQYWYCMGERGLNCNRYFVHLPMRIFETVLIFMIFLCKWWIFRVYRFQLVLYSTRICVLCISFHIRPVTLLREEVAKCLWRQMEGFSKMRLHNFYFKLFHVLSHRLGTDILSTNLFNWNSSKKISENWKEISEDWGGWG